MWIVRLALRRPYTFVVMSILILIMGGLAIVRTPTDIFPNINIPVVSIIWNYNGLTPEDINDRIVSITERALTTTVDNIEHIESQSLYGVPLLKSSCSPRRIFNKVSRRSQLFLRPSSGSCLQERRRLSFLPTAHRVCPSSSWPSRGRIFQNKNSTTTA